MPPSYVYVELANRIKERHGYNRWKFAEVNDIVTTGDLKRMSYEGLIRKVKGTPYNQSAEWMVKIP